ncbi:MAG: beta-ketoacyl synthase chain length factor [Zoogloeaceae bacterium]|jgi:hypothetical protein|nr:beta-ketoacyl synthase chain length factor [Zoogloeaceae bacterium]
MALFPQFSLSRWSAWAPAKADVDRWYAWARGEIPLDDNEEVAAVKAMPPLLRRRAHRLGRAALETLYAPELAYADQPIVFCSRHGELARSVTLLQELAAEGKVSPQEFSMAVHNAIAGLFLIAKKSQTPIVSLASENRLALSGMVEALALMADGASSVILVFCDTPLPALFHHFLESELTCFAFALEMTTGKDYRLTYDGTTPSPKIAPEQISGSALSLLRFVLDETQNTLPLTETAEWKLLRLSPEAGHA